MRDDIFVSLTIYIGYLRLSTELFTKLSYSVEHLNIQLFYKGLVF